MGLRLRWKKMRDRSVETLLLLSATVSILTTIGIVIALAAEAFAFYREIGILPVLLDTEWTPLFAEKHFGIWPLIAGTVLTSAIALLVALPIGLVVAVYLSEFATAKTRAVVKPILEILAGIPTVVYGYFALLFVTPLLQRFIPELPGFNALSPGIVMGVMIIPIVASLSEDALFSLPRGLREGAYALGANRVQAVVGVLLPAASGGIAAAFVLGLSRAVGETMIVAIAAGQQPRLTVNPLEPVQTMTAYIVQVSLGDTPYGSLEFRTIFAVGSILFLVTLGLNSASLFLQRRFYRGWGS